MTTQEFIGWLAEQIDVGKITTTNSEISNDGLGWVNQKIILPDGSRLSCGWTIQDGELNPYDCGYVLEGQFDLSRNIHENWRSANPENETPIWTDLAKIIADLAPGRAEATAEFATELS